MVNIKARIKRHSRIIKHNISNSHHTDKNLLYRLNYNIALFLAIFLLPVYPLFASFFYDNTVLDFYRGDIDETSIIDSYMGKADDEESDLISKDSYLSIVSSLEDERDLTGVTEIIEYQVQSGDSFSVIADKFEISKDTIYWANNFSGNKILQPGEKIKILPVSGMFHEVKEGETLDDIAKKYSIEKEKIIEQNKLPEDIITLEEGIALILPGAKKPEPPKPPKPKTNYKAPQNTGTSYNFVAGGSSTYVNDSGTYQLVRRKPQHTFYWGNCTRFVAQYKNVNWGGNAKDWLANAKAKGHATGVNPGLGSIVVFHGKGYNPRYGHVAIVIDIKGDHIVVKDMNYRRLNEVTVRQIPKNDRAIRGYIYVE